MEGEALKDEAERADAAERAPTTRTQFGALCWRVSGGKPQILLVHLARHGPLDRAQGLADRRGLAPHEAAAREAWEEAGVKGDVGATCLGLYPYIKVMEDGPDLPCTVALYPIRVRRLADDFPEARSRRRRWMGRKRAAASVATSPSSRASWRPSTPRAARR